MSYYYNYFLGYQNNDDGLFYPLGPYDMNGNLHDVFSRSRSFASNLHERFSMIPTDKFSEPLKKEFTYENCYGEKDLANVRYLYLEGLPETNYLRKGYFLIEDIKMYEDAMRNNEVYGCFDYFYDYIPLEVFPQIMQNEITFGKSVNTSEEDDSVDKKHSCRDYAFYIYPDYTSEAYEASMLINAVGMYEYGVKELDNARVVIMETEG